MSSLVQANVTFQGSITSLGTLGQTTYAPVDLGVNSLSLASGNLTSLITTTSSAPTGFAAAGEGALVFPGTANAYISFGTTGQPFSNSNIYSFGDFVVEAWVNPTSLANTPYFIGFGDPQGSGQYYWQLQFFSTAMSWVSYLNGVVSTGTSVNGSQPPTGTWSHVAVIHQSASKRIQLYLNGQPQQFQGSSGGFSTSGTVISYTTGIIPVTGQQLSVGQLYSPSYTFNGSLTNLRITTGSGAAQIYNNNAFTPSTSPLFPASNTAGGSLTTRLLVRVPLAANKMVVPKLGGANCNTVLAFPPAPMTSYATNMTGQSYYGQGTYVASASSENSGEVAWYAFDKSTSTFWRSPTSYTANAPYSGSVRTVDVNGTSYAGEWCQIQLPSSIVLSNYVIYGVGGNMPTVWYVLGSRDGTNWNLVDQRNFNSWSGYTTFTVSTSQAFTYYRFVFNTSNGATAAFYDWTLNGTIEGPNVTADGRLGVGVSAPTQALEVAGSAVVAGTLSAGNPLMFRNRLVNGDMRVWQRGTTFSSVTASTYTTDRWCTGGNAQSLTVAQSSDTPLYGGFQNSLSITSTFTSGSTALLEQRLERVNSLDFYKGTTFVISFWAKQTAGTTNSLSVAPLCPSGVETGYNAGTNATTPTSQNATLSSSWTYYTMPFAISSASVVTNGLYFQFYWLSAPSNPSTVLITGVQLEKGSVATPFEVRPYATELALCQRYYYAAYLQTVLATYGSAAYANFIYYKVPMRTNPVPTFSTNNFYPTAGGSAVAVTPTVYGNSTEGFSFNIAATTYSWGNIGFAANAEL